jgi:hypothetical protein
MADTACCDSKLDIMFKKLAKSFLLVLIDSAFEEICESFDFLREKIREKEFAVSNGYRGRFCWTWIGASPLLARTRQGAICIRGRKSTVEALTSPQIQRRTKCGLL